MTIRAFDAVLENWRANRAKIQDLLTFDELVMNLAISQLERVKKSQDAAKITNYRHRVDRAIDLLKRIRENDSLAPHIEAINNQSLVLLVSYLAAALHDLYRVSIEVLLENEPPIELLAEELKVTVAELLRVQVDHTFGLGDLLIEKKDLSFQDMQSTARAFRGANWIQIR